MKIYENGLYRELTPEEVTEFKRIASEQLEPKPTIEERLEAQVLYTALMTDTLLEENK